jgi:HSP20 family protein
MAEVARRQPALLPDLLEWLGAPWTPMLPFAGTHALRVEDYAEDDHYVVRAELPGVDPRKDVDITVEDQTLTVHAQRRQEHKEPHHCEFRYGEFTRSVRLPASADTEHITAAYDKGILEVTIPVKARPAGRRIEVTKGA